MDIPLTYECAICRQTAQFRCSGCREVHYCSQLHQKEHWLLHKLDCTRFRQESKKHIPSPDAWACGINLSSGFNSKSANGSTRCSKEYAEKRMYEWLVDCYRLRLDDDCTWGDNYVHGSYTDGASKTDIVADFIVFVKLAKRNGVVPESISVCEHDAKTVDWDWNSLFTAACTLLPYAFDNGDAKAKYPAENHDVFEQNVASSSGSGGGGGGDVTTGSQRGSKKVRSLRATGSTVYGCCALTLPRVTSNFQCELEQVVYNLVCTGNGNCFRDEIPLEPELRSELDLRLLALESLLLDIGGFALWRQLHCNIAVFEV